MKNYTAAEKKSLYDNAVAMVMSSLKPSLDDSAPVNFTNGKNVTYKNEQDARLLVTAAIEGYKTNLWATPRQIRDLNVGAIISPDAAFVPIFMEKTSSKGNTYLTSYDVVNLDCVSWPNGMPNETIGRILDLAANPKPTPKPTFDTPSPLAPRTAPEPVKITAPLNNDVRKPNIHDVRAKNIRHNNKLDRTEKQHVGPERKPNVVVDLTEYGIHIEARTTAEAQLMLECAVKARLALTK